MKFVTRTLCFGVLMSLSALSSTSFVKSEERISLPNIEYLEVPKSKDLHGRQKRKITNFPIHPTKKWPTIINYLLSDSLTKEQHSLIEEVLTNDFAHNTCLRFNKIASANESKEQFILFRDHANYDLSSCKAYIGKENDTRSFHGQPIYLSEICFELRGTLVHMIAATLGMYNEVQRTDRDNYVDIFWDNINPLGKSNFVKQSDNAVVSHDVPYDLASAVHYRPKAWLSLDVKNTAYTVLPKDRNLTDLLGQVSEISYFDVQVLNHAYCSDVCSIRITCLNGGYQDPRSCTRCRCRDGYTGNNCENVGPSSSGCNPASGKLSVTDDIQCVNSPGYGTSSYTLGDTCSWLLEAPSGKWIDVWFYETIFSLPYIKYENKDMATCIHWVEIKDKGLNATRGVRYCSKDNKFLFPTMPTRHKPLTSQSSDVMVSFKSPKAHMSADYSPKAMRGFKLCYKISAVVPPTVIPTPQEQNTQDTKDTKGGIKPSMLIWIIVIIVVLLIALTVFGIVIICLLRKRRKQSERPEPTVIVNSMNNPGYASEPPVVSFTYPEHEKKLAVFGAVEANMDSLPPKYDDIPTEQTMPYAISGGQIPEYTRYSPGPPVAAPDYQSEAYEIPDRSHDETREYDNPVYPASSTYDNSEPIYQNSNNINNLRKMFQN